MNKKILGAVLLVGIIALSGCHNNKTAETTTKEVNSQEKKENLVETLRGILEYDENTIAFPRVKFGLSYTDFYFNKNVDFKNDDFVLENKMELAIKNSKFTKLANTTKVLANASYYTVDGYYSIDDIKESYNRIFGEGSYIDRKYSEVEWCSDKNYYYFYSKELNGFYIRSEKTNTLYNYARYESSNVSAETIELTYRIARVYLIDNNYYVMNYDSTVNELNGFDSDGRIKLDESTCILKTDDVKKVFNGDNTKYDYLKYTFTKDKVGNYALTSIAVVNDMGKIRDNVTFDKVSIDIPSEKEVSEAEKESIVKTILETYGMSSDTAFNLDCPGSTNEIEFSKLSYGYYYKGKNGKISNADVSSKISMAYRKLDVKMTSSYENKAVFYDGQEYHYGRLVSEATIKDMYNKMFGEGTYERADRFWNGYMYSDELKGYAQVYVHAGEYTNGDVFSIVDETYVTDEKAVITIRMAVALDSIEHKASQKGYYVMNYKDYMDFAKKEYTGDVCKMPLDKANTITVVEDTDKIFSEENSKYNHFRLLFEKDSAGNYVFTAYEMID